MITLRPDQIQARNAIVAVTRGIVKAPAGSGKTIIAAGALDMWLSKQSEPVQVLWLGHTKEQCEQAEAAIAQFPDIRLQCFNLDVQCYQAGTNATGYDLVICDECHHIASPEFRKILDGHTGVRWGFSATPEREDNLKDDVFELIGPIVYTIERTGLVETGKLAHAKVYWHAPNEKNSLDELIEAATLEGFAAMEYAMNFNKVKLANSSIDSLVRTFTKEMKMSATLLAEKYGVETEESVRKLQNATLENSVGIDAKQNMVDRAQPNAWLTYAAEMELKSRARWQACQKIGVFTNELRNKAIIYIASRHIAAGDSTLILVGSVEHGGLLQQSIPGSLVMHSKMGAKNRREAMAAFRDGSLKCAIATSLADEGLDVPRVSALILAAAGRSKGKAEQRTGRVLREFVDKTHGTIHDFWDWQHELLRNQSRARGKVYAGLNYEFCARGKDDPVLPVVLKSIGITLHPSLGMEMPEKRTSKKCDGNHAGNPCRDKECWLREDVDGAASLVGKILIVSGESELKHAPERTPAANATENKGTGPLQGDVSQSALSYMRPAQSISTTKKPDDGPSGQSRPDDGPTTATPRGMPAPVLAEPSSDTVTVAPCKSGDDPESKAARESTTKAPDNSGVGLSGNADNSRGGQNLQVVHCKKSKHDVYIGRPSKWGNPFEIGIDGTREEVIQKYRDWILKQPELLAALPELLGKTLGCWCAPQACHGDVLIELLYTDALLRSHDPRPATETPNLRAVGSIPTGREISEIPTCEVSQTDDITPPVVESVPPSQSQSGFTNPLPSDLKVPAALLLGEPTSHADPHGVLVDPPERKHARLSPSTLRAKAICPGFINDPTSDPSFAERGTLGHKAVESEDIELCGDDIDLIAAVKRCIAFEKTLLARLFKVGRPVEVLKEIKVYYYDQFGYFDELIIQGITAHLLDWKFAIYWYAADSPQFWAYCAGVWNAYPQVDVINVYVAHPFLDTVDTETFNRKDHYDFFLGKIAAIMTKAEANRPEDYRVTYQCRFCGFAKKCSKLAAIGLEIGERYADVLTLPEGSLHGSEITDPIAFAKLMKLSPVIEKAAEGWRKAALELHDAGTDIPGFKLINKKGNRKVASAKIAFDVLKKNFLPNLTYEKYLELCTVSATQLDDTVSAATPDGKKKAARDLLGALLEDEDAMTFGGESRYLMEIKVKK